MGLESAGSIPQGWWAGIQSGKGSSGGEEVQKVTLMANGGKRGA